MKHFELEEFRCGNTVDGISLPCPHCGGQSPMKVDFLDMLDACREYAGVPFVITSGYRCEKKNTLIGGVYNSAHTKGMAADIRATDATTRYAIVEAAFKVGFTRIGVAKSFIHLDNDHTKPQELIWTYD